MGLEKKSDEISKRRNKRRFRESAKRKWANVQERGKMLGVGMQSSDRCLQYLKEST